MGGISRAQKNTRAMDGSIYGNSNPTTLDFWQESITSLMKTFRPGDTFATTGGISGINATIDRTEFLSDRAIEPIDQFRPLAEQFVVCHSLRHPSLQDLV